MSQLVLDGEVIWENPEPLGHFGIRLRKQIYELELCDWLDASRAGDDGA